MRRRGVGVGCLVVDDPKSGVSVFEGVEAGTKEAIDADLVEIAGDNSGPG